MPLNESQTLDARRAGVAHPGKIRLLQVEALPEPEHEELMFMAQQVGLFSNRSLSLSLGYGICLLPESWENRQVLVHEFVHVGQYEKRDGLRSFLGEYLRECVDPGYPFGSLEQQAILISREICKQKTSPLVAPA